MRDSSGPMPTFNGRSDAVVSVSPEAPAQWRRIRLKPWAGVKPAPTENLSRMTWGGGFYARQNCLKPLASPPWAQPHSEGLKRSPLFSQTTLRPPLRGAGSQPRDSRGCPLASGNLWMLPGATSSSPPKFLGLPEGTMEWLAPGNRHFGIHWMNGLKSV